MLGAYYEKTLSVYISNKKNTDQWREADRCKIRESLIPF